MSRILVIPDLHTPYHHPGAIDFLSRVRREFKPTEVVCIGDEIDAYHWSTYPKDPDAPGRKEELSQSRHSLRHFYRLFPKVKVCHSNHTYRPYKRAYEAGIGKDFLRSIGEVLGAPKTWVWAYHWRIGKAHYFHGDGFSGQNGATRAMLGYLHSIVMGHLHSWGGVTYKSTQYGRYWALNVGCLIDVNAVVFDYARNLANRPTLGCGIVDGNTPVFIPYEGK